jgi:hypothetical protein
MPGSRTDFQAVLDALTTAGVRFVVIGGVAMLLHGANNVTFDIDISFARDRENLNRLSSVLVAQRARLRGLPPDLPILVDVHTLRSSTSLTLETQLGDFDLLAEPAGVDSFEGLYGRSKLLNVEGTPVHVACVDDIIAMKRAADRPKDREHIMQLLALQRLVEAATDPDS